MIVVQERVLKHGSATSPMGGGSKNFFVNQIFFLCYWWLVSFMFMCDQVLIVTNKFVAQVRNIIAIVRSITGTMLEFSKNVHHYYCLARKFFKYGMYNKIN